MKWPARQAPRKRSIPGSTWNNHDHLASIRCICCDNARLQARRPSSTPVPVGPASGSPSPRKTSSEIQRDMQAWAWSAQQSSCRECDAHLGHVFRRRPSSHRSAVEELGRTDSWQDKQYRHFTAPERQPPVRFDGVTADHPINSTATDAQKPATILDDRRRPSLTTSPADARQVDYHIPGGIVRRPAFMRATDHQRPFHQADRRPQARVEVTQHRRLSSCIYQVE